MVPITRCCCRAAVSSLLLCAAGLATAADSGFYIGLDEGWVKYPGAAIRQIGGTTLTGSGLDDTNFTWNFAAGYRFDRYLRLEAGYVDLSNRSGLVSSYSGETRSLGNASFSAKGETLIAIGTLPFGKWDASLKVGVLRADAHLDFSGTSNNSPLESHVVVTNTHPLYGTGVDYNINTRWRAQLGYTLYREVATIKSTGTRVDGPNINTLTVGIAHQF
jgi:OmpA-like transmembrane domain